MGRSKNQRITFRIGLQTLYTLIVKHPTFDASLIMLLRIMINNFLAQYGESLEIQDGLYCSNIIDKSGTTSLIVRLSLSLLIQNQLLIDDGRRSTRSGLQYSSCSASYQHREYNAP